MWKVDWYFSLDELCICVVQAVFSACPLPMQWIPLHLKVVVHWNFHCLGGLCPVALLLEVSNNREENRT